MIRTTQTRKQTATAQDLKRSIFHYVGNMTVKPAHSLKQYNQGQRPVALS